MSRLAGKVALVTGGSSGIGRATALALAKEGASVVINYSRSKGPADEVVAEIGSDRAIAIQANVGKVDSVKDLVAQTVAKFQKIDILVLNAASINGNASLDNTTEADFDEAFAVNVKGQYFLTQEAAKYIPDGGRVIFFSTSLTAVSTIMPIYLLYAATKGAVEQMSRVLAKDLGRRSITVNTISPGPTATDGFYTGKTEPILKAISAAHPAGRIAQPNEIADVVVFIASPESSWVNGQNLRVNGGMTVG